MTRKETVTVFDDAAVERPEDKREDRGQQPAQDEDQKKDQKDDQKEASDGRLADLLAEIRVMLTGAQMLTAFLILLPFNATFEEIAQSEKYVFLATFFLAVASIVLLSAPAIQHRIMNPLRDRPAFKRMAIRHLVIGGITMALAFILATDLVISRVFGQNPGMLAGAVIALLILCLWLLLPYYLKCRKKH